MANVVLPVQGPFLTDDRRQGVTIRATKGATVVAPEAGTVEAVITAATSPSAGALASLPAKAIKEHVPGVLLLSENGQVLHYVGGLQLAGGVAGGTKLRMAYPFATATGAPVFWSIWRRAGKGWSGIEPERYLMGKPDDDDVGEYTGGPYGRVTQEWRPADWTRQAALEALVWLYQERMRAKLPAGGGLIAAMSVVLDDDAYGSTSLDATLLPKHASLVETFSRTNDVIDLDRAIGPRFRERPYKTPKDAAGAARRYVAAYAADESETPRPKPTPKPKPKPVEVELPSQPVLPIPPYEVTPPSDEPERLPVDRGPVRPLASKKDESGLPWLVLAGAGGLLWIIARRRKRARVRT